MNIKKVFLLLSIVLNSKAQINKEYKKVLHPNNCITFSVSQGTGCDWMCQYCSNSLGTNNYYFTTDICKYETGGCIGNPQAGVSYTCCSI